MTFQHRLVGGGGGASSGGGGDPRVTERLRADKMVLRYPDGAIHRVKRVFGSRLAQRWMRGEDMDPFIDSQLEDGANSFRVFCQFHLGIALNNPADIFRPQDSTQAQWQAFFRYMARKGARVEPTILADCAQLGMNHAAQLARIRSIVEVCQDEPNASPEFANEFKKNSDDPGQLARELGYDNPANRRCLMVTGDYDWTNNSMVILDVFNYHADRIVSWPSEAAKEGHNLNEGWDPSADTPAGWKGCHCPVVEDESLGFMEGPPAFNGRRESRPDYVEDGFAGYAVGMAGATCFSDAHHAANVPGDGVRALTRIAFAAMDDVPLDMPTGVYVHDGLANHPLRSTAGRTSGEVAGRILGNRAYIVAAEPRAGYIAEPINGWRIVRINARGNRMELARGA
jgi:hypothetical protein